MKNYSKEELNNILLNCDGCDGEAVTAYQLGHCLSAFLKSIGGAFYEGGGKSYKEKDCPPITISFKNQEFKFEFGPYTYDGLQEFVDYVLSMYID